MLCVDGVAWLLLGRGEDVDVDDDDEGAICPTPSRLLNVSMAGLWRGEAKAWVDAGRGGRHDTALSQSISYSPSL
jgi:hypothetical protein